MFDVFEFRQFFSIAENMLKHISLMSDNNTKEAVYRGIVNRAYYASHMHCREWLEVNYNLKPQELNDETGEFENKYPTSIHKIIIIDLKNLPTNNEEEKDIGQNVSSKLERLYDRRIIADYKLNNEITLIDAEDAIEEARFILNNLKFKRKDFFSNE